MAEVLALKTGRDEWAEQAVARLEEALVLARERPLSTVAIVMLTRDGDREVFYSTENRTTAVGALFTMATAMAQVEE